MRRYENIKYKLEIYQGGHRGIAALHRLVAVQARDNTESVSTIGDDAVVCGQQLGERRMAMRRETFEKGSEDYVERLKSLGCIMYAPLREDLQDRISGNSFVPTGDGAYTFVNGYCEVTVPSTSPASPLNITIPALATITSKDYTVLCEAQLIQKSVKNNSCRMLLFSNQAISSEGAPQWHANPFRSAIPTNFSLNKAGRVYNWTNKSMQYLLNGAVNSSETITFDITSMSSPYNKGFTLGCAGHNNYRNCKFRVRDLMFFTAALDLATIKQIQGL